MENLKRRAAYYNAMEKLATINSFSDSELVLDVMDDIKISVEVGENNYVLNNPKQIIFTGIDISINNKD